MARYYNVMESIAEKKLDEIYHSLDCCHCEQCRSDILAFALNRLPTKYVATPQGEAYSKTYSLTLQHDADIIAALTMGARLVAGNPRH